MALNLDTATLPRPGLHRHLYVQVLIAIALGVAVGASFPETGASLKWLGDLFIRAIKMLIAPIIFCTIVHGIASMESLAKVGRVGVKALLYFEVVTTLALAIGLVVVNLWKPGLGMNVDPATLDAKSVATYSAQAGTMTPVDYILHIIPQTVTGAFADGDILQIVFFSVLFGFALFALGDSGKPLLGIIERVGGVFFQIVKIVMRAAPIGAFGAMAFTIGKYGLGTLISLGALMACFYLTCLLFVFGVLGLVAAAAGFNIWRFVVALKEELLIVLGTSSSESVLPRMMTKMEAMGCDRSVVGLVIPTGYSFNLDGTCIYLTLATVFLAQATDTPLSLAQQLGILAVLLITSKGAAGVTGSGFIVLAATLQSVGHVPVAAMALILGVDRFMSEARALTNLVGNGVATVVIARWEGALDREKLKAVLTK